MKRTHLTLTIEVWTRINRPELITSTIGVLFANLLWGSSGIESNICGILWIWVICTLHHSGVQRTIRHERFLLNCVVKRLNVSGYVNAFDAERLCVSKDHVSSHCHLERRWARNRYPVTSVSTGAASAFDGTSLYVLCSWYASWMSRISSKIGEEF